MRHPALELLVERVGGVLTNPDDRCADLGQPADKVALGRWKERLDKDDVHSRMIPCRPSLSTSSGTNPSSAPHGGRCVCCTFLLPATARLSLRRPRCRTSASASSLPSRSSDFLRPEAASRRALASGRRARPAANSRGRTRLEPADGQVERLVGALEQLQVPMAYARQMLGLDGMDVETALNVRDKSRMKSVLRAAGVPCARHQLVTHPDEALAFAETVGFPLVAKPPAGAGAQATYRLDDLPALRGWLEAIRPHVPGGGGRSRGCSRSSWSGTSTASTA